MATRKSKSVATPVETRATTTVLTLTVPLPKPRNRVAMNPLLKKSTVHADADGRDKRGRDRAQEVRQDMQEALNRRRKGAGNED